MADPSKHPHDLYQEGRAAMGARSSVSEPPPERRMAQRRSEANTPRSEAGPERRKLIDQRAAVSEPLRGRLPNWWNSRAAVSESPVSQKRTELELEEALYLGPVPSPQGNGKRDDTPTESESPVSPASTVEGAAPTSTPLDPDKMAREISRGGLCEHLCPCDCLEEAIADAIRNYAAFVLAASPASALVPELRPCLRKFVTCDADEGQPETWCENCKHNYGVEASALVAPRKEGESK